MAAHNFENCFIYESHENLFTVGFEVTYFRFAVSIFKFKMAVRSFDKFPIFTKICTWGFSEMLITNPLSYFKISKCRFESDNVFVISYPKTA